jgi:hypothetical protein
MNGMPMASLPWQPQCAVISGVGDSEIFSKYAFGPLCIVSVIFVRLQLKLNYANRL